MRSRSRSGLPARDSRSARLPEDCGGVWSNESFLEAIRDPQHPEHYEMLEWVGGEFDPELFGLAVVNQTLRAGR
jgi:hypothetical protein